MKYTDTYKILGLIDDSGGSNVGVVIPLRALSGKSIIINEKNYILECHFKKVPLGQKKILEEDLILYDACFFHWLVENSAMEIDWLGQKTNCIMINFMDDFINENAWIWHPQYEKDRRAENGAILRKEDICAHIKQRIILQAAISNLLIATTQPIVDQLLPFSDSIHLSPNYLPYGEEQYEIKNNLGEFAYTEDNDYYKGRILVIGSSSHFNDFIEIKNIIRKISDDSEIHNNMKWVIAGVVKGDKQWQKFIDLFSTNKKMEVEILESSPIDSYMELYSYGDVVFQPLQKNFFNEAKSSLKIAESSCYNLPLIGSDLYSKKELTGYLKCEKPIDYYNWIKYFAKNKNWVELGTKLSEINRKESNFPLKIERLRQALEITLNRKEYTPKDLKIFGLTYKDEQFTEYERYDNSKNPFPQRFEYQAFMDIIDNKLGDEKYLGALSWRFPQKSGLSKKLVYKLFEENLPKDVDFINLAPKWFRNGKQYMDFSEQQHPGLTNILKMCLKNIEKEYIIPKNVVFSNFFIMKTSLWKEYINEWVKPSIKYMEEEIWELVNIDSGYQGISKEELKKINELEYFCLETFILERLVGIFLEYKQLNIVTI